MDTDTGEMPCGCEVSVDVFTSQEIPANTRMGSASQSSEETSSHRETAEFCCFRCSVCVLVINKAVIENRGKIQL